MFRVGQKVVCVNDQPRLIELFPYRAGLPTNLQSGQIYTITGTTVDDSGEPGVYLAEAKSSLRPFRDGRERSFWCGRFRPIVERKTDISIFTEMLTPAERKHEVAS